MFQIKEFIMDFSEWQIWQVEMFGNNVGMYFRALVLFIALILIFNIFQRILLSRLTRLAEKTKTDLDDAIIDLVIGVKPPFYSFLAFYLAIATLSTPDTVSRVISMILLIWTVYLAVQSVHKLILFAVRRRMSEESELGARSAMAVLGRVLLGILWAIGGLFVLSNMGVNISSMMAGLGVGGIAIAIAAQNVLGDLFSAFAIYFDKPFVPGDFIIVGDQMGTVQKIGIKTTRIMALQGEELVIPNQEITSSRIQNFKKMSERRIVFTFGLVYHTPLDKLKRANEIIKEIFEEEENARLNRAHFFKFDSSSLTFEVVYYVTSPDYNTYMDIQQDINYKLKERFANDGLEMAYPTQTVYVAK